MAKQYEALGAQKAATDWYFLPVLCLPLEQPVMACQGHSVWGGLTFSQDAFQERENDLGCGQALETLS